MRITVRLTRKHLAFAGALAVLAAAGAAYATIPDSAGTYTACELKATGTIRLIDPSLGSSSLLGHCTALEAQLTWNQHGQNGQNGLSPTVGQLGTGDSHCPAGGASLTDAGGNVAYVCNGRDGADGKSFAGTFTSPNGEFTLAVSDAGVNITGPGSSINLSSHGALAITAASATEKVSDDQTIEVGHDRTLTVGHDETQHVAEDSIVTIDRNATQTVHNDRTEKVDHNETIKVGGDRTENVGGGESVTVGGSRTEDVGSSETVTVGAGRSETVGGPLDLTGSFVTVNGGTSCLPAARESDLVDSVQILTGSSTVCIGG